MKVLKVLSAGAIVSLVFVFGSMFLFRSCLSQYDERFALPPGVYFEKGEKKLLVTLIQFNETRSYSYNNGITYKVISTSYFVQSNDAVTGEKVKEEKVVGDEDVKTIQVEMIGATDDLVWIFAGEPIAFDPFTLERKADVSILESKNPQLKRLLPQERRFYQFNPLQQSFFFTANDGTKWQLDCSTLKARVNSNVEAVSNSEKEIQQLDLSQKKIEQQVDSLFAQLRNIKSTGADYYKKASKIHQQRSVYYKQIDSLRKLKLEYQRQERAATEKEDRIDRLQKNRVGYDLMRTNQDTVKGNWYGIYSEEELATLPEGVNISARHSETARRNFYTSSLSKGKSNEVVFNKELASSSNPSLVFLQGGFLLDKNTASPITLQNSSGFLIVSRDIIGDKGKIILTRITDKGEKRWAINTNLAEWEDWRLYNDHLYIFGADNDELGSRCNFVRIVNLENGKGPTFDYFEDRIRK